MWLGYYLLPVLCHYSPSGSPGCAHDGETVVPQIYSEAWPPIEIKIQTHLKKYQNTQTSNSNVDCSIRVYCVNTKIA